MADICTSKREALKHWGCLTLTDKQLKRVLKEHGVKYLDVGNCVLAWDGWGQFKQGKWEEGNKWVKVSGWGTIKLREWLGY